MKHTILIFSSLEKEPWAGSEEMWFAMALRLVGAGHRVVASVWEKALPHPRIQQLQTRGVEVLPYPDGMRTGFRLKRKLGITPHRLPIIHADAVFLSLCGLGTGLAECEHLRRGRIPYVTVTHAVTINFPFADEFYLRQGEALATARRSWFVSAANLRDAQTMCGPLPNGRVVRNPCRITRDPLPWPGNDDLRLLCPARFDLACKGQDLLLAVLARPHWRNRPVSLTCCGSGQNMQAIRAMVDRLGLAGVVTLRPFADDLLQVWAQHHALILPSRVEGLPLVIPEAMRLGRPVIATDVAGNRELVQHGLHGFIAESACESAIDRCLEEVWASRSRLCVMGLEAAAHIRMAIPVDQDRILAETFLVDIGLKV